MVKYELKYCEGCQRVNLGNEWEEPLEWIRSMALNGKKIPQMNVEEVTCEECEHEGRESQK